MKPSLLAKVSYNSTEDARQEEVHNGMRNTSSNESGKVTYFEAHQICNPLGAQSSIVKQSFAKYHV